jgi:hypothetical protein
MRVAAADADIRATGCTEAAEAAAGHGNDHQKIHYHRKVKDDRDKLKVGLGFVWRRSVEVRNPSEAGDRPKRSW